MTHRIELTAADGFRFPVYQALPAGPAKGAVVVLQEIFGVNAHIRAVADSLATQGYLALAPSTFHRVEPGVERGYTAEDIAAGVALKAQVEGLPTPGVLRDIQATVDHAMVSVPSGKVGMVGYCWGGLLTWRAACELRHIAAAVTYYGGGMPQPAEIARMPQVPVLAHFARQDQSISLLSVEAFRLAHPEAELYLYDASHGFNCDHRAAYNAAAASLARDRTLEFIRKNMS
jgi:carboxymethylenebutenolidase